MALFPLQARIGDYSTGHWVGIFYYPPVPLVTGSHDTYSCCINASRVTDTAMPHFAYIFGVIPFPWLIHTPMAATGAKCTFINYLPAFRTDDFYNCGDVQAEGCLDHPVGDFCIPELL